VATGSATEAEDRGGEAGDETTEQLVCGDRTCGACMTELDCDNAGAARARPAGRPFRRSAQPTCVMHDEGGSLAGCIWTTTMETGECNAYALGSWGNIMHQTFLIFCQARPTCDHPLALRTYIYRAHQCRCLCA
jgi:hypothetical protein